MRPSFLLVFFFFFTLTHLQAQKIEVEREIKSDRMPKSALSFLSREFPGQKKRLKFYREASADVISYEAKFLYRKEKYSVEFFQDGRLMDIEKEIVFNTIPDSIQNSIECDLAKRFRKYKIVRAQSNQNLSKLVGYEFVLRASLRGQKAQHMYECFYRIENGSQSCERIIGRASNFIFY